MKKIGAFVGASVLLATTAWAQGTALDQQIIANERAINDAIEKGDGKSFLALLAPGATVTDASGTMNTADLEKLLGMIKITSQKLENIKVSMLSADVALVTYTWSGIGTAGGQKMPSPTYASTAWVKQKDGKWRARFHQESIAMGPPPAPARGK